jgi:hypothetical protein
MSIVLSLHVVTMHRYGITNIATNDSDFERVEWVLIWKPCCRSRLSLGFSNGLPDRYQ